MLLYHRVAILERDPWRLAVSPARFEQHLQFLKRFFRPVPLRELVGASRAGDDAAGMIAVTFDDGYADNCRIAQPLLEKHGIPVTYFVTSGAVLAGAEFWWDALEQVTSVESYEAEWTKMRSMPVADREERLRSLGYAGFTRDTHRPLTIGDLRHLSRRPGVEIGAHGVTHSAAAALDALAFRREVEVSRHDLERLCERKITSFAYPFGGAGERTEEAISVVRDAGYELACSSLAGPVTRQSDPYWLPRCNVLDWTWPELARHVSGWMSRS